MQLQADMASTVACAALGATVLAASVSYYVSQHKPRVIDPLYDFANQSVEIDVSVCGWRLVRQTFLFADILRFACTAHRADPRVPVSGGQGTARVSLRRRAHYLRRAAQGQRALE